ncbi:MAG: matrixin family metalloprotease, partial [Candidatus Saccharibacteria bacterium]
NRDVDNWNKRKDITQTEYDRLNAEKKQLQAKQAALERTRKAVNAQADQVNASADRINALGRKLNLDVEFYNGKFGKPKEFDQGVYTGSAIDIYQFNNMSDLEMVLAHELGHALTLDHVQDPEAIMYYLMQKQDLENIHATSADIRALDGVCTIK